MDLKQFALDVPRGLEVRALHGQGADALAPGDGCALTFRVTPPLDAQTTKAYFHRDDPETDAIYKIDSREYVTLALPPPPVSAHVVYSIEGEEGVHQRCPHADARHQGRRLVDAAGGGASIFGGDVAGDADHSRRGKSFRGAERRSCAQLPTAPAARCIPRCRRAGRVDPQSRCI